jgi:hypothetical protein
MKYNIRENILSGGAQEAPSYVDEWRETSADVVEAVRYLLQ